jgi:hypothetical protein
MMNNKECFLKKIKLSFGKLTPLIFSTCMMSLVTSCGNSGGGGVSSSAQELQQENGSFKATLHSVNSKISNSVRGTAVVSHTGDTFSVKVVLENAPAGIHMQNLRIGTACPTASSDKNKDGYIDAVESQAVTGRITVPFDADLSSQNSGANIYPTGSYTYSKSTSYGLMLTDLRQHNDHMPSSMMKLNAGDDLPMDGRVVAIYGVYPTTSLPKSVETVDGLSSQQSIVIACGTLSRVVTTTTPSTHPTTHPTHPTHPTTGGTSGGAPFPGNTTGGTTGHGGTTGVPTGPSTGGTTGTTHPPVGTTTGGTAGGTTVNPHPTPGGTTGSSTAGSTTGTPPVIITHPTTTGGTTGAHP